MQQQLQLDGVRLSVRGRLIRVASLADEGYEFIGEPRSFLDRMHSTGLPVDVLSFTQSIGDPVPRYAYVREQEAYAVMSIDTYDHWWKRQINDKTRNMVRKAGKKGLTLRSFELNERAVLGIKAIYDESPLRQGKPFKHFGKSPEVLLREHATYADRSDFVGAFNGDELVGFIKLVHQSGWSSLMQIISSIAHRDKAPTNALIAKAVEICAQRGIKRLQYGIWSRRSMGDFKAHHAFEPFEVPRYFVPVSLVGHAALRLGLHKPIRSRVPEHLVDRLAALRERWNRRMVARKLPTASAS